METHEKTTHVTKYEVEKYPGVRFVLYDDFKALTKELASREAMKTANEVRHTPTPWIVDSDRSSDGSALDITVDDGATCVVSADCGSTGVNSAEEAEANAQFIVRAVNSHEALLEAAKHMHGEVYDHEVGNPPKIGCHDCEVIAQAEGR